MTHAQMMKLIMQIYQKKQTREGQHLVEQLLLQTPKDSFLWEALGIFLNSENHPDAAIGAYRRALEYASPTPSIYGNMGNALMKMDELKESLLYHELAIKQDNKSSRNWMNYGIALRESNRKKEALKAFEKSVQLDNNNFLSLFNIAIIHLYFGEYKMGWEFFENRIAAYPDTFLNRPSCPIWAGEDLKDKTLIILSEQGYGDNILSSRFIPEIHKNHNVKVVLLVPKPLVRLFKHLGGVDILMESPAPSSTVPLCDYYINIMSLPHRLKINSISSIPKPSTLQIDQEARNKIAPLVSLYEKKFKVGIVWTGKETNEVNRLRSIPIGFFLQLLKIPEVELFSFQKGSAEQEIHSLGLSSIVHNLGVHFADFADTAAAVDAMDLIIMMDSAVGHLAGSLGKPTWVLLHDTPYWLWLDKRTDSPWYPSIRLYRQKIRGNWQEVFDEVVKDLAAFVTEKKREP